MKSRHKSRHNVAIHKYKIGDLVYFHALSNVDDESTYFMCKGYVSRCPKPDSKVYKIVVTSVDPKSVLCGERPDLARVLLGKKIARKGHQMSIKRSDWARYLYGDQEWLEVKEEELKKIKGYIQKKMER